VKKLLLAGAALAALATNVQAADLGSPRGAVPAVVVAAMSNWTGFYLGAQIGYGWGPAHQFGFGGQSPSFNMKGVVGGITAGYNYQISNVVLGIEGDLSLSSMKSQFSSTFNWGCGFANGCTDEIRWFGTVRGRLGLAVDRFMIFATGGLAVAGLRDQIAAPVGCDFGFCGTSTKLGWTVGAGVEAMIAPNWTAKAEYLYMNFGNTSHGTVTGFGANHQAHIVRVGVNYLFSTGPSAVVARY
jgi:outer membrane immunogenic protein